MPDIFISSNRKNKSTKQKTPKAKRTKGGKEDDVLKNYADIARKRLIEAALDSQKQLQADAISETPMEMATSIAKKTATTKSKSTKKKNGLEVNHKMLEDNPAHDKRPFSAFRFYPRKAEFLNKDPEEKVVLLLRRHRITNSKWILISILMLFAPAFFTVLPFYEVMPESFQIVIAICWYLIVIAYIFEMFLSWFFNVNIVTDERVFDVDFIHLTHREMTDANIDQIQDVTVEMNGAIRTMFNYGDVIIQTAAEQARITFEAVPYPDKVARILRELRIEEEVEKLEGKIR